MSSTVRTVWNSKSCGHSSEASNRKFGHCIHLLDFKKCSIDMPLEASLSAGFNFVPICLHCTTSVVSLMTDTLLTTNVCNLLVWFAMYFSTVCLSAKNIDLSRLICNWAILIVPKLFGLIHLSTFTIATLLRSCSHSDHWRERVCGISLSHPMFLLHNSCNSNLEGSISGEINPKGSYI